jgi:hypothetical protein
MLLDLFNYLYQAIEMLAHALGMIKLVFSSKERQRIRAQGPGELRAAVMLGIAAWSFLLVLLGGFIYTLFRPEP